MCRDASAWQNVTATVGRLPTTLDCSPPRFDPVLIPSPHFRPWPTPVSYVGVLFGPTAIAAAVVVCALSSGCALESFGAQATLAAVLPQASTIQGRDGGGSGVVWGHSVWTYGDTILNENDVEGTNWHNNSFSITDDLDAADGIGNFTERLDAAGAPLYFLPPTIDEDAFNAAHRGSDTCAELPCGARYAAWPGSPIWDAARSRALVFYGLVYAEPGNFNFHGVGQSVAIWSDYDAQPVRPVVSPGAAHPTLLFGADEQGWGTAALLDNDTLYALACDTDHDGLSPPCYLAQVPPTDVLTHSAWTYWNGTAFVADVDQKRSLFDGASSVTVAKNAHLGKWSAIYAQPLSNHVVIRTADALTGPWSEAKLLFDADKNPAGAYDSNWHTEYDSGNTLYVTYSRTDKMGWFGSEFVLERVVLP